MRVYIVRANSSCDTEYDEMFRKKDWKITADIKKADLLQFTGGEDVSPSLYGEAKHPRTYNSLARDKLERIVFNLGLTRGVSMSGICRGGQFLNVMCGGEMWQDLDNHGVANGHDVVDERSGEVYTVSSTHHQMMRVGKECSILATAQESTWRERMGAQGTIYRYPRRSDDDIEVVSYPKLRVLCFQPHPEFPGYPDCTRKYFQYLEGLFN